MNQPEMSMQTVDLAYGEVHNISVMLLTHLGDADVPVGAALAGLALTIGRLLSPDGKMTETDEAKFIQDALDWVSMYWTHGKVN